MDGWQVLAEESRHLVDAASSSSFPARRSFQQVADLANSLKDNVRGGNFNQQEVNATRLLARGGIDARQLETPVRLPAKRPVEDVSGVSERATKRVLHPRDVGGFASQHAIDLLTRKVDESTYGRKRVEIERRQATQPFPSHTLQSWAYPGTGFPSRTPDGTQAGSLSRNSGLLPFDPSFDSALPPKEQGYVDVVSRMTQAREGRDKVGAIPEFLDAASGVVGSDESIVACWTLLSTMTAETETGGGVKNRQTSMAKALLRGARKFLETRNDMGMLKMVQTHRSNMYIGGDPDKLKEIQNFVVYKHKDSLKLDLENGQEGLQTSWVQVYYALRSGHVQEALRAAGGAKWPPASQRMRPLRSYIEEWADEKGSLSHTSMDDVMCVCRAWLNNASVERRTPLFKFKVLTLAFLCGSVDLVDQLGTSVAQPWESLDEYLWFFVGCTRATGDNSGFNLQKLQKRIREFSADFYSRDGKAPMTYVMVLLASLQFKTAIQFLAQNSMSEKYRSEAVHMALALHHHGILDAGLGGDVGTSASRTDFGVLVESYGHQFTRSDSFLVLKYYLLAVDLRGNNGSLTSMAHAFRRVVLESRDYRQLLGNGGKLSSDHPLRLFLRSTADIDQVLFLSGQECEKFSENDEAYAIYMAAARYNKALGIVNIQIAQVLQKWVHDAQYNAADMDRIEHELLTYAQNGEYAVREISIGECTQREGFMLLEAIARVFRNYFQARFPDAIVSASIITFLPSLPAEASAKAELLKSVDHSLVHVIPDLLRIYASALINKYKDSPMSGNPKDRIAALITLARIVPPPIVVGQQVFKELDELSREVMDFEK